MSETDNTKVKEFLKVKSEQLVKRLSEMTINEREINNFFESRELKPIMEILKFDSVSDKYAFKHGKISATTLSTDADTHTLTCPANRRYRLLYIASANGSRGIQIDLSGTIGGTTVYYFTDAAALPGAGEYHVITASIFLDSAGNPHPTIPWGVIELQPGDTISVVDLGYVAADGHITTFIYEEIRA